MPLYCCGTTQGQGGRPLARDCLKNNNHLTLLFINTRVRRGEPSDQYDKVYRQRRKTDRLELKRYKVRVRGESERERKTNVPGVTILGYSAGEDGGRTRLNIEHKWACSTPPAAIPTQQSYCVCVYTTFRFYRATDQYHTHTHTRTHTMNCVVNKSMELIIHKQTHLEASKRLDTHIYSMGRECCRLYYEPTTNILHFVFNYL